MGLLGRYGNLLARRRGRWPRDVEKAVGEKHSARKPAHRRKFRILTDATKSLIFIGF
jgi:hypothetical protein